MLKVNEVIDLDDEVIDLVDECTSSGPGKRKEIPGESEGNDPKKMRVMAFAKITNALGRNASAALQSAPAQVVHIYVALFTTFTKLLVMPTPNLWLKQLHEERALRCKPSDKSESCTASAVRTNSPAAQTTKPQAFTVLTWNVWFNHDARFEVRMKEIGDIITSLDFPTVICLQEVTMPIAEVLSKHPFWTKYTPCPWPISLMDGAYFTMLLYRKGAFHSSERYKKNMFPNSQMGRGILSMRGTIHGKEVLIATSHLESPLGWKVTSSGERTAQAKKAIKDLTSANVRNVIYAGDMNWARTDGSFPLQDGWLDVWEDLNPKDDGYTYDGRRNPMLGPTNKLRSRLDRVMVRLADWKPASIVMVGTKPILESNRKEAVFRKETRKGFTELPLLPSDHFGLYAKFVPN